MLVPTDDQHFIIGVDDPRPDVRVAHHVRGVGLDPELLIAVRKIQKLDLQVRTPILKDPAQVTDAFYQLIPKKYSYD